VCIFAVERRQLFYFQIDTSQFFARCRASRQRRHDIPHRLIKVEAALRHEVVNLTGNAKIVINGIERF